MLRLGTLDDVDLIVEMAQRFHASSPYSHIEYDPEYMKAFVAATASDKTKNIIILLEEENQVIGMIAATTSPVMFNSKDKVATELVWWVEPEHRKSRHSLALIKAFEFWGKKMGCSLLQMALVESEIADKLEKLYLRLGYFKQERQFLKRI